MERLNNSHRDVPIKWGKVCYLIRRTVDVEDSTNNTELSIGGPVRRTHRRGAFIESQEHCGGWMASTSATTLSDFHVFVVAGYMHAQLDAAPSTRIPDLSRFKDADIDALYGRLFSQIDELQTAYAGLLSHLNVAVGISTETESLLRKCFFLQHNLAAQFEMLGMDRCAGHSREVESRLALMPPIHKQYPLHELSADASQQRECIWTSPLLLLQLITMYQLHMTKQTLPLPAAAVC